MILTGGFDVLIAGFDVFGDFDRSFLSFEDAVIMKFPSHP